MLSGSLPQQMTAYRFHAKNISFFFDRVGYSSLQNSAIILREHIKKKKGELIENTGKIVHVRVETMTAHTMAVSLLQALVCEAIQNLICLFNVLLDISVSIVNYGISFLYYSVFMNTFYLI